jgi:hypothetical protein
VTGFGKCWDECPFLLEISSLPPRWYLFDTSLIPLWVLEFSSTAPRSQRRNRGELEEAMRRFRGSIEVSKRYHRGTIEVPLRESPVMAPGAKKYPASKLIAHAAAPYRRDSIVERG